MMAEDNSTKTNPAATETEAKAEVSATSAKTTKQRKRTVASGQLHIQATFNNTIVVFTDKSGAVLVSGSAGANGFRGSKKGTAYAAQIATEKAAEVAKTSFGMSSVDVFVKGVGLGRDSAIRAVSAFGISINSIKDVTPIQHGGVRRKGERKP